MSITIVLADDHMIFSQGLQVLLTIEDDLEVLTICTDGAEALDAVAARAPDILVVDHAMPGMSGLAVLEELRDRGSDTRGILLTASLPDEALLEALRMGVPGILLKESAAVDLVECVRKVARGEHSRDPGMVERGLQLSLESQSSPPDAVVRLTPRQRSVLELVSRGMSNKGIAHELGVSEGTVKVHVHHLFKKMNVSNRVQLALRGFGLEGVTE